MTITLSLIQTSQNRRKELGRFVESLNGQVGIDFKKIQLIFIDQEDNRDVFEKVNSDIKFTYIKYHHCSLSHARNVGLPKVEGKYIGFPDDDCWYEPNTLCKVLDVLNEGKYQGVTGKGCDANGVLTNRFPQDAKEVLADKQCGAISYTMFYKFQQGVFFDENMGVGSPYNLGAGEETDYMLNLMEKCMFNVIYDSHIIIHHPSQGDMPIDSALQKAYSYARGDGYLMQKHRFPLSYKIRAFVRPLGGLILYAMRFKFKRAKKSMLILRGRIEGYFYDKEKL